MNLVLTRVEEIHGGEATLYKDLVKQQIKQYRVSTDTKKILGKVCSDVTLQSQRYLL